MTTPDHTLEEPSMVEEHEGLLELLFEQKRALELERQRRLRMETVLSGLERMIATPDARDAFDNLVEIARPLLEFEHAMLVRAAPEDSGSFVVDFSTHPELEPLRWTSSSFWEHVLRGEPAASFNVALVPEWRDALAHLDCGAPTIRSALHVALDGLSRPALFVCVHQSPAFFSTEHLERIHMLSPLVTQLLINQERLQAKQDGARALQASQAKSHFLATMSHELRTPLTAILGYAELMLEESQERGHAEYYEDIESILSSANHLLELINDILDLSRVESGRLTFHWERVELGALLEEAAHMVEPLLELRGNTLTSTLDPRLGTYAVLDRKKTLQVLLNLLSNAAKFTQYGEVRLHAKPTHGGLAFIISDTGIGISEHQQRKLFQAFGRVHEDSHDIAGTGLGLVFSRQVIRSMGGDITVKSTPCVGSTFTVRLPTRELGEDS
ncbi:MAG: ATP-binding protein [Myxococcota bacterium]